VLILNQEKVSQEGFKPEFTGLPSVMLTIRPSMLGWGGLMRTCGAAATCVWPAYGLRPSHFDRLCQEGIQLTSMNGARAGALAF